MSTIFHATFDGKALHPEEEVNLKPNTRYVIIIEEEANEAGTESREEYPLTSIRSIATDAGVSDLAINHNHYAHGRPKNTDLP